MYTLRQKYLMLTGKGQTGGKYCNAIDENLYDNNEWSNYMPSSGYSFKTLESGKVQTIYTDYFACYDGYDCMDNEPEIYNSLEIAINNLWVRESLDKIYECFSDLKNAKRVNLDNDYLNVMNDKGGCSYNVKNIMSRLYHDIYPSLSGIQ
jgi:hypothetical protein